MPGKAYRSLKNPRLYEALKRRGYSKASAARISNAAYAKLVRKRTRRRRRKA